MADLLSTILINDSSGNHNEAYQLKTAHGKAHKQEQLAAFDHFKEQLSEECNKIPQEWVALKIYVVHFRGLSLLQARGDLLRDRPS